jgi:hypothetical protein
MNTDSLFSRDQTPFLIGSSAKAPRPMYKILDVPVPAIGKHDLQSSGFYNGRYYVFHSHSIVQVFIRNGLEKEYKIRDGSLVHPNDAHFYKDTLWICDTNDASTPPIVKKLDIASMSVVGTHDVNKPDWRTAAVSIESDSTLYAVAVENIPVKERHQFLVRKYDYVSKTVLNEMLFPFDQYYVQGCTLAANHLYVTTNNGGHAKTGKFIDINLETNTIVDTIIFENFGESEGLHTLWVNDQLNLLTGQYEGGLFRIVV